MSAHWWEVVQKNNNVKIHVACYKIWERIIISSQYTMDTGPLEEKQAKQLMITFHLN